MKYVIALAGNPNVGKSTIFNSLTGLRQHTGNWTGKTVACATGYFDCDGAEFAVVDLPGTYSLTAHSREEEIARDYICSGKADLTVVISDATCLERGLHLLKQIEDAQQRSTEQSGRLMLCVNLCDEARKKGIIIDFDLLQQKLCIPTAHTEAHNKKSLEDFRHAIASVMKDYTPHGPDPREEDILCGAEPLQAPSSFCSGCGHCMNCPFHTDSDLPLPVPSEPSDMFITTTPPFADDWQPADLARAVVTYTNANYRRREERMDRILTAPFTGGVIMFLLLLGVFWITITGANYPSKLLWNLLYAVETFLADSAVRIGLPSWFIGSMIYGVYRVLAWVVSVMLPPMAIFFPLFTLLEDFGYLPRIAFNMDSAFKKCKACGKQCLTMWLGTYCMRSYL